MERTTRTIRAGRVLIGGSAPIAVQSMCATPTRDVEATLSQIQLLEAHGADIIRVAIDSRKDVEALKSLRQETDAVLVVDLQESYRLVEQVAPLVQKVRYNPGHLHHHQKNVPVRDKVAFLVDQCGAHNCAIRIGVNLGSLDPEKKEAGESPIESALASVREHIEFMDQLSFSQFLVSLKSSDPNAVIEINRRFHKEHPEIPVHLGVTEAGMLPLGEIKTRVAFENLIPFGVGDTIRVSLTLPFEEKYRELEIGRKILADIRDGRFRSVPRFEHSGLNIISCPSCSRVENTAFVELAQQVKEMSQFAEKYDITIAVMGCRVNGPGETDDADIGLWCAPNHVNLKRGEESLGVYPYDEILERVRQELQNLVEERFQGTTAAVPR